MKFIAKRAMAVAIIGLGMGHAALAQGAAHKPIITRIVTVPIR